MLSRRNIKHVRFADETTSYWAPPVYPPIRTTYPRAISRGCDCIRLHRYLENFAVDWNLLDAPSMITRNGRSISSRTFGEPATEPPLVFVTITLPHLSWTINVYPSQGPYITLYDVFNTAYRSLRTNITRSEFKSLLSQNDQECAIRAYKSRYRRHHIAEKYEAERCAGMKRVDFLMGHTRFVGVSNTYRQPQKWQFNVTW